MTANVPAITLGIKILPPGSPIQQGGKFAKHQFIQYWCVVNLSAGRNRFYLDSASSHGKQLYLLSAIYDCSLKRFCSILLSRLAATATIIHLFAADDAYPVQICDTSYFVATWWRGWFIFVQHSKKKLDNVAKLRPESNTEFFYNVLDGYPASLGFPIMHKAHAICTQSIIAIT